MTISIGVCYNTLKDISVRGSVLKRKFIQYSLLVLLIVFLCTLHIRNLYYGGAVSAFWGIIVLDIIFVITYFGLFDGINSMRYYRYVVKNGIKTKATIKGYKEWHYRTKEYQLILTYKDNKHNTYQISTSESITFLIKKYRKGRKILIAYLENNTEKPVLIPASFYYAVLKLIVFGFFCIGSLICAVGISIL